MQIVKTMKELYALVDTSATIGTVSIQRKDSLSDLHPGHANLISYSKKHYDITAVNFWDADEAVEYLYGVTPYLNKPWDSTATIEWCQQQGVDIVLIPDYGYSKIFLNNAGFYNTEDDPKLMTYRWIDNLWKTRNYPNFPSSDKPFIHLRVIRVKTIAILMAADSKNNTRGISRTRIISWKDGITRFIIKDFIENVLNPYDKSSLLDPLAASNGLYHSSCSSKYTTQEIAALKRIQGIVHSTGYEDSSALVVALNAIKNPHADFSVYSLEITKGGLVGNGNVLIDMTFKMGSLWDRYPFYLKGVINEGKT